MIVHELISIGFVGFVDQTNRGVCQFILLRYLNDSVMICVNELDNIGLLLYCESASDTWFVHF